MLPQRILPGEVAPRQLLIDHHHRRGVFGVGIGEQTAAQQRNAHDAEVSRRHHRVTGKGALPLWRQRPAFDGEQIGGVPEAGRQFRGLRDRGRLHPGDGLGPLQKLFHEGELLRPVSVAGARQIQRGRDQPVGLEAQVDVAHLPEALDRQARAGCQNAQRGDFAGRDQRQDAHRAAAPDHRARAHFDGLRQPDLGGAKSRRQAEQQRW